MPAFINSTLLVRNHARHFNFGRAFCLIQSTCAFIFLLGSTISTVPKHRFTASPVARAVISPPTSDQPDDNHPRLLFSRPRCRASSYPSEARPTTLLNAFLEGQSGTETRVDTKPCGCKAWGAFVVCACCETPHSCRKRNRRPCPLTDTIKRSAGLGRQTKWRQLLHNNHHPWCAVILPLATPRPLTPPFRLHSPRERVQRLNDPLILPAITDLVLALTKPLLNQTLPLLRMSLAVILNKATCREHPLRVAVLEREEESTAQSHRRMVEHLPVPGQDVAVRTLPHRPPS